MTVPILVYDADFWTLNKKEERKIEVQKWFYFFG